MGPFSFLVVDSIALSKNILGSATEAMDIMQKTGVGIASLFLLFVVFHDVASLLDGGKFQLKMLLPLLIYLIVCNFNLFASPVLSFTSAIQSQCATSAHNYKGRIVSSYTNGAATEQTSMWDAFMICMDQELSQLDKKVEDNLNDSGIHAEVKEDGYFMEEEDVSGDETSGDTKKRWNLSSLVTGVTSAIENMFTNIKNWWYDEFVLPLSGKWDVASKKMKWGALGVVAMLFSWIAEFLELAVVCLGAVMTGIMITFGPITFAFAVFPGNQRTIGSWLIRLCQFSLYAPLVALITSFVYTCLFKLGNSGGAGAITSLMGLILCDIVALASIPSIASMIIEGASGAVSLSSGLQTASAAMGAATSVATAPMRAGYRGATEVQSWMERGANIEAAGAGEVSRDNAQLTALNSIAKSLDPNFQPADLGGGGGGSPTGQNNH